MDLQVEMMTLPESLGLLGFPVYTGSLELASFIWLRFPSSTWCSALASSRQIVLESELVKGLQYWPMLAAEITCKTSSNDTRFYTSEIL